MPALTDRSTIGLAWQEKGGQMVGKSTRYGSMGSGRHLLCGRTVGWAGQFEWKSGFEYPGGNGLDNDVRAFAVFDDGKGPARHAGGVLRDRRAA